MTGEQIHRRTWRLDILWLATFFGLVAQNISDKPNYLPDFFRGLYLDLRHMGRTSNENFNPTPHDSIDFYRSEETEAGTDVPGSAARAPEGEPFYGTIALLRSTDCWEPSIRVEAKLFSWQTYSNSSVPGSHRSWKPAVHGAVYAPMSSIVTSYLVVL